MKLIYTKTHLLSKLHDELIKAKIPLDNNGASPVQGNGEVVYIYIQDDTPQATIDQIETIVNAHDPTPPPYQPTGEEQLMLALTDVQFKIVDQQQLIDLLALVVTELQLQGGII